MSEIDIIKKSLKKLGIEGNGKLEMMIYQSIPADAERKKRLLLMQINSFQAKLERDLAYDFQDFTPKEISELRKGLRDVFYPKKKSVDTITLLKEMKQNVIDGVKRKNKYSLKSFPTIQNATAGLESGLYLIGAESQIGKTAIIIQMAVDILLSNDNSRVVFITSDDTKKKIVKRFISCLTFYMTGGISNATRIGLTNFKQESYNDIRDKILFQSYELLELFTEKKRLIIKAEKMTVDEIALVTEENSDAVILVDAVYKLGTGREKLEKDISQAEGLKEIQIENDVTMIAVKNVRKSGERGGGIGKDGERITQSLSLDDLKGDGAWSYEPDFIVMMWSDKDGSIMSIQKNKVDGIYATARFEFFPHYNGFRELTSIER
ncbi:MAG TPA: DnaB-like helicase C-terminal domain-containing protein [bacterium]|nr:DnaB-like helicase C-terminal domain-containing protein [bacterium]